MIKVQTIDNVYLLDPSDPIDPEAIDDRLTFLDDGYTAPEVEQRLSPIPVAVFECDGDHYGLTLHDLRLYPLETA